MRSICALFFGGVAAIGLALLAGDRCPVVQELLRHASARITMDIYAQAITATKRAAHQKVVEMVRPERPLLEARNTA
jgi:integrase